MAKKENKTKKHFFKDFKAELKKVIWPTPKQLANNTSAVIAIVLVTAVIVFVLDVAFDLGNKYGITNLQNVVNEKYNTENDTTDNTNTTDNGENNTNSEYSSTEENNTSTEENTTSEDNQNTNSESEQTNPEQ